MAWQVCVWRPRQGRARSARVHRCGRRVHGLPVVSPLSASFPQPHAVRYSRHGLPRGGTVSHAACSPVPEPRSLADCSQRRGPRHCLCRALRHVVHLSYNAQPTHAACRYAKNFGLYGERTGALLAVCATADAAGKVLSQLKQARHRLCAETGLAHVCTGLAHICAGTRPHLHGTRPHLRWDSPTSARGTGSVAQRWSARHRQRRATSLAR